MEVAGLTDPSGADFSPSFFVPIDRLLATPPLVSTTSSTDIFSPNSKASQIGASLFFGVLKFFPRSVGTKISLVIEPIDMRSYISLDANNRECLSECIRIKYSHQFDFFICEHSHYNKLFLDISFNLSVPIISHIVGEILPSTPPRDNFFFLYFSEAMMNGTGFLV